MKKERIIRLLVTAGLLGLLIILWAVPSDLAYNVAQERDILLGRYTLDRTIMLLIVTPVLLLVVRGIWTPKRPPTAEQKKLHAFRMAALALTILPTIVLADIAMRLTQRRHYVGSAESYHRTPNKVFHGAYRDRPEAAFSYPRPACGYGDVKYTLTVDAQGFRNAAVPETCDWIVLGDSFAEGSEVSDEQTWPVLLASARGVSLYNLGMSGGNPVTYLDTFKQFGLRLKPQTVIYLLYEGNDLRDSNFTASKLEAPRDNSLFNRTFKTSPLRRAVKEGIVALLAPVGSRRFYEDSAVNTPGHPMYPVAWLPVRVPTETGPAYAFDLKRLLQHFITPEAFARSTACVETFRLLSETRRVCDENGIRLVVVFAPDKPHLLIEHVVQTVPAPQLHAFVALKVDDPPAPDELGAVLLERAEVQEKAVERFCRDEGIDFLSLTQPLRQAAFEGIQTYYTYDQHWTAEGHAVVARFLAEHL